MNFMGTRMQRIGLTAVSVAVILGAGAVSPVLATPPTPGTYIATGHDLDFHCSYSNDPTSSECGELTVLMTKVRHSSTLPVLAINSASGYGRLDDALTLLGISHVNVNVHDAAFASTVFSGYSAIVVGSWYDGFRNPDVTDLITRTADFVAYYNGGGGIISQTNGGERGSETMYNYYDLLGFTAASVNQRSPRTVTALGTTLGITSAMVNCCATHNAFLNPPAIINQVLEVDVNNVPVSLMLDGTALPAGGIGGGTLEANVSLALALGAPVAGAQGVASGAFLLPNSVWTVTLQSTPTVLVTGSTNLFGAFSSPYTIPTGLAAGDHTITLTGLAPDNSVVTRVLYITIAPDGTLSYSGSSAYVAPVPSLAKTGVDGTRDGLLGGGALLVVSLGVFVIINNRRRRNAQSTTR